MLKWQKNRHETTLMTAGPTVIRKSSTQRKDFVVIGWVDFDKNEVGFYGWLTGERIARFPVVEQNSYRGYRYLTPNHEFQWGEMNKNFGMLFHEIYRS